MINALVVLALLCQDADLSVTGHGRRHDGGYELAVSGKGKALLEKETVALKFRRLVNRIRWEDGAILAQPGDEVSRSVEVEKGAFTHREPFAVAGEVEVRVEGIGDPRTFRVSSLAEEAHAIAAAAKGFDVALRGVRLVIDDVEALQSESCPPAQRLARLQKRIDWRKNASREEIEANFLGASAHALTLLMTDVDAALDLERHGRSGADPVSSLTGKPFTWKEAGAAMEAIEEASLRERALLIVRAVVGVTAEIAAGVRVGESGRWSKAEKEFARTIETLHSFDQASRSGPAGERYASATGLTDGTLADLLAQVQEYLQAGGNCVQCERSEECRFFELGQSIMDRAAAFEAHLRTRN